MSGGAEPLERQVILNDFYRAEFVVFLKKHLFECDDLACMFSKRREQERLIKRCAGGKCPVSPCNDQFVVLHQVCNCIRKVLMFPGSPMSPE